MADPIDARHGLAGTAHALLERHVLQPWFPRCIDRVHGGYHCDFDHAWRRSAAPSVRFLEFQARQTRVAALALRMHPDSAFWRECLLHGWTFLSQAMWDAAEGGWYALCEADGTPRSGHRKHMHGTAYVLQACLDVHELLGIARARELVDETIAWSLAHAWVPQACAFRGWLERDGAPVRDDAKDHCGVPAHLFDGNVNCDMVETLADLVRAGWPMARELEKLLERSTEMIRRSGSIPEWFTADGEPRSPPHAGRHLQAIRRFARARLVLGLPARDDEIDERLWHTALAERGPSGGLLSPSGVEEWWVQFEWFAAAAYARAHRPRASTAPGRDPDAVLAFLRRRYFDERHGGVHHRPPRLHVFRRTPKGSIWKDASHEAFAFAEAAGLLGG